MPCKVLKQCKQALIRKISQPAAVDCNVCLFLFSLDLDLVQLLLLGNAYLVYFVYCVCMLKSHLLSCSVA